LETTEGAKFYSQKMQKIMVAQCLWTAMDDRSYSIFVVFDGQPTREMAAAALAPRGGERRFGRIVAPTADASDPARYRKTPQRPEEEASTGQ
jgi:hypothetical protein